MKKLVSYSLLLLFLFCSLGYFPFFLIHQTSLRKEIKQKLKNSVPEKELTIFTFNKEEFSKLKWEKKNKEFHYENSMFDIVRMSRSQNDCVVLYCINDLKEKQLFEFLEKEVGKNTQNTPTKKNSHNIFKLLNTLFSHESNHSFYFIEKNEALRSYSLSSFLSFIGQIATPPPKPLKFLISGQLD